jgi:hypothetical protein
MMKATTFSLPKRTGTYADALAAIGLGRILAVATGVSPTIVDAGWAYEVGWNGRAFDVDAIDFEGLRRDPQYRYVKLSSDDTAAPELALDYAAERVRYRNWRDLREQLRKENKGRPLDETQAHQLAAAAPEQNWLLYQNLQGLKAYDSYNSLHRAIREQDSEPFVAAARARLRVLASQDEAGALGKDDIGIKVSAVQAFNPTAGKGTNQVKAAGPALRNLSGDWFEEWLKCVGAAVGGRSALVKRGDKYDIKLLVMAPAYVDESRMPALTRELLGAPGAPTSIKADIRAALHVAGALVSRSGLKDPTDDDFAIFYTGGLRRPNEVISGLQTGYFTSLGSARALTNVGFVGPPRLVRSHSRDRGRLARCIGRA